MDEPTPTKARKEYRCSYCGKNISAGSTYRRAGDYRFHDACWSLSRDPSAPASVAQQRFVNALLECECRNVSTQQASLLIDRLKGLREVGDSKARAELQAIRDAARNGKGAAQLMTVPPAPRQPNEYEGHLIEVDVQESDTMRHKESVQGVVRVREITSGKVVHEEPVAGSVNLLKKDGPTTGNIIAAARDRCRWWINAHVAGTENIGA